MGIRLKQAGFEDFVIFERDAAVGGTWRDNHYPGAACDVPSHLYSLSFAQNPDWSRHFAPQAEILDYTLGLVERFGLAPHLRLGEGVDRACFDDSAHVWEVETTRGVYRFDVLIPACGGLSRPSIPSFEGLEKFEGEFFHTAAWRHDVDLRGKKVAVIGTGASAIQVIPAIVDEVGSLDVFMRTPPWILPREDYEIPLELRELYRRFPALLNARRASIYAEYESHALAFFNPVLMGIAKRDCEKFLKKSVVDEELRRVLTPNYLPGCKRILLSDDFYPAVQKPQVELIGGAAKSLTARGIVDEFGTERACDVVVMATGFKVAEEITPFDVEGTAGTLDEAWSDGAQAYKGSAVCGFPNLFILVGPNTALGHNSMIYMIEAQVQYVLNGLEKMRQRGWTRVEVRSEAQRAYNARTQKKLVGSVWESGCVSWYRTRDGKNTTVWPDFTFKFRSMLREFDDENYRCE